MLNFNMLRLWNFLAVGNAGLEIRLNKHPMTLVIGENGAGKSTMIDALVYALFGTAYRNVNNALLINTINNAGCLVELEFTKGMNKYKIIRGQKPNIFEIYENDIKINQDASSRDYQKHLERAILGFNKKTFCQVVVVGINSYVPFMRLTPKDRRVVIENLLDIEIFGTMTTITKHLNKTLFESLDRKTDQVNTTIEKINLHRKHIENAKETAAETKEEKKREIQDATSRLDDAKIKISTLKQEVKKLKDSIKDRKEVHDRISELGKLDAKLTSKHDKLSEDAMFFTERDDCPTCRQTIFNKEEMLSKTYAEKEKVVKALNDLFKRQKTEEARLAEIEKAEEEINTIKSRLKTIEGNELVLEDYITRMTKELKDTTVRKLVSDAAKMTEQLVGELEAQQNEKKDMVKRRAHLDMIELLLKDSGIKAKIIKHYMPIINQHINKYLAALDFFVEFELDEQFNETIKSRYRDTFAYESFSEGQKKRIDLALLFTWRSVAKIKNSVNCNLLILDEVLDNSLDSKGMEAFLKMLGILNSNENIYLISHRSDILIDKFEHINTYKKPGLFTELETGD